MNKIYRILLLCLLLLMMYGLVDYPDNNFHVVMCDVGQGDSMLIYRRFSQVLIDGGGNDAVSDCLLDYIPWFDRNIELMVMTHPQEDHIAGLSEVVKNYNVGVFITSGGINDIGSFWELKNSIFSRGISVNFVDMGDKISVGEIGVLVKWPEEKSVESVAWEDVYSREEWEIYSNGGGGDVLGLMADDPNEDSVVLEVKYKDVSVLTTGDIGHKQEQALLDAGVIMPVNVIKVPHHGSKYSSSLEFLQATRPEWAIISVGEKNRFGHPSGDVLMYLDMVGAKILRTDENGTIELVSDGKKFWMGN